MQLLVPAGSTSLDAASGVREVRIFVEKVNTLGHSLQPGRLCFAITNTGHLPRNDEANAEPSSERVLIAYSSRMIDSVPQLTSNSWATPRNPPSRDCIVTVKIFPNVSKLPAILTH